MNRKISKANTGMIVLVSFLQFPASIAVAQCGATWTQRISEANEQERTPEGLSASDWSSIRAAYEDNRHAAFAVEGAFQARNPGQQWRTNFDGRGFVTEPNAGGWCWGLELVNFGREGAERVFSDVRPANSRCGQRVEYEWDESLTEWYINDPRGLEHGFTVHRRPDRAVKGGGYEPLQFTLAVRGDLHPRISADARGVMFVNSTGAAVVNYTGLAVFDADGAELPARFADAPLPQASGLKPQAFAIRIDDRTARYPLTIDPIAQQAYLKASNTGEFDVFGNSVAVSDDTIVVGAFQEDSNATGVDGNQADNTASSSGAAYVFVRTGATWTQQAYLKASNTGQGDNFGWSVAVSGDTVVVGALREASDATGVDGDQADDSAFAAGAAYVFVRSGTTWSQQAYLKASNTDAGDFFGHSVYISGDTVVVGAPNEDSIAAGINGNQADNSATNAGAVYVFVRSGTTWSQQAYIKAVNTGEFDAFGFSVSISDDTVVAGATNEDSISSGVNGDPINNNLAQSGAAYVFVRSGTTWGQQAYLKASNTGFDDLFGWSVAVSGDTVVVGANQESSNATGVNGNQADNSAFYSGAAYVFFRSGTTWSQQAYLKASNTGSFDEFGRTVSVSGDTVVVGALSEASNATGVNGNQSDNSASSAGAAYVFARSGPNWSQQAYLKASNTGTSDKFGHSVAVSGDTVVVGALSEASNATGVNGDQSNNSLTSAGAAYVFLNPAPCPSLGNMNCDCAVDIADVEPFVLALLDPDGYAAAYPNCDILNGDMQPDGNVDALDVPGFMDLVIP